MTIATTTAAAKPPTAFEQRNRELFTERDRIKARLGELGALTIDQLGTDERGELRRLTSRLDEITTEILQFNYGLVRSYVRKFTSNTSIEDSNDFEAAAVVGLMRAIDSYQPDKGKFGQWAFKPIQREVLKAVRDSDHPNMNPGDFERRPDILRALQRLQEGDLDYRPSYEEIAAAAGVTVEQVHRVLDAPRLDSLSTPVGDDGETELGDLIEDDTKSIEDTVLGAMEVAALEDFGLTELEPRELFVLIRRFGLDCEPEMCLSDIGEQLNLSREAVRQIEAKALAKLNHPFVLRRLVRHGRG